MIRWLRWNLFCWRGRRCADLKLAAIEIPDELEEEVVGTGIHVLFKCDGCGTLYSREALLGRGGSFTTADRERVG